MKFPKLNKPKIIGLITGILITVLSSIFFFGTDLYYFLIGIAIFITGLPFIVSLMLESRSSREKDEMFLEFSRDLVEGVRSGTPISRSILNIKTKDYGKLSVHIQKLANQIALGIPLQISFQTFARDVGSKTISRAIAIISESEKAGGQIEDILDSVARSVAQSEKLKKERMAAMYTLVVQGYIIFLIFIVIMLVMQFKILPITSTLNVGGGVGDTSMAIGGVMGGMLAGGEVASVEELTRPFIWLLLVQGLFAGLVIGKLSEGKIVAGIKHSFVLVVLSLWINAGAKLFLSPSVA